MAAMNFPSSPVDGQTYTNPDTGVIYTYNSADGKWKTSVTSNAFLPLSGGTLSGALNVTDIKHASSASNNIVLASDGSATIATLNSTTITGTTIQGVIKSGTAVASTSGTAIDFTSIPSWVKRVTVMLSGVSTNGTSIPLVQLGDAGGIENTGYTGMAMVLVNTSSVSAGALSSGFRCGYVFAATQAHSGTFVITKVNGNDWVCTASVANTGGYDAGAVMSGNKTLSDTLDRIRITTVNGTDTFDAGTINILYEG